MTDEEEVTAEEIADEAPLPFPREDLHLWELRHARRRGGESSYRHQRPNQFYPLYVDPEAGRVVGTGEALPLDREPSFEPVDGLVPLWPIDKEGNQRCWRYIPDSIQKKIDGGFVVLGQASADGKSWTVNYWVSKTQRKKYKTVWWSTPLTTPVRTGRRCSTSSSATGPPFPSRSRCTPCVTPWRPWSATDPTR